MDDTEKLILTELHTDVRNLTASMLSVTSRLAAIEAKMCSRPNACVGVEAIIAQHTTRIDKLEAWRWQLAGGLAVLVPVLTVVGNMAARKFLP